MTEFTEPERNAMRACRQWAEVRLACAVAGVSAALGLAVILLGH